MKHKIGEVVNSKADASIVLVIDGYEPEKYRCHWFRDGILESGYFMESALSNRTLAEIGFRKELKNDM